MLIVANIKMEYLTDIKRENNYRLGILINQSLSTISMLAILGLYKVGLFLIPERDCSKNYFSNH